MNESIYTSALNLIEKYGREVTVTSGETILTDKAFIQPLRHGDKRTISGSYTETVIDNSEQFLYIGSPNLRLDLLPLETTSVETSDETYILKKADSIFLGSTIIYIRAILSKE